MRLGGPLFKPFDDPEGWIAAMKHHRYRAAYCPIKEGSNADLIRAYADAAQKNNIVIAEVGAFGNNPICPEEGTRKKGIVACCEKLELAEQIGARCCVNVAGSRSDRWAGPHEDNYGDDTFDLIVQSVRMIIDSVKPKRAFYALEMMPWIYPDSPDSNLELIRAVDRSPFAVHLDPVNIVNSPRRYYDNAGLIRDCFVKLGPYIKSCHAKDILLHDQLTVHLDEVRPGLGNLDYRTFLRELAKLDPDTPLMLEHLKGEDEYAAGAEHVRGIARECDVAL